MIMEYGGQPVQMSLAMEYIQAAERLAGAADQRSIEMAEDYVEKAEQLCPGISSGAGADQESSEFAFQIVEP